MEELLPLDAIEVTHNPRQHFDQVELLELANSIATHGVLQPILVMPIPESGRYQLIAGERRWRASLLARRTTIPAIIAHGSAALLREIQLEENLRRVPLTPLEEARAFLSLQEEFSYSIPDLARRFQRTRNFIRDRLALLSLCSEAQEGLAGGRLPLGAALALRKVEDTQAQRHLACQAVQGAMTVEQTTHLVAAYLRERRLLALRLRREEHRERLVQELSKRGPVVTSESYQPQVHHRYWDLCFPECSNCLLKGQFLRADLQVEEVCVRPACYNALLERSREERANALAQRKQEHIQAFARVIQVEEVTHEHLFYLLWMLIAYVAPMDASVREQLGLAPYSRADAARSADWEVISSWTYSQALTTIFSLCTQYLAALPNDILPPGMKQSLMHHFALPAHVLEG